LKKKKIIINNIIIILILLTIFSGCIENDNQLKKSFSQIKNSAPIPIINATNKAFFDEIIEFDASNSYDPDGIIKFYSWDFGDNQTTEGIKEKHIYKFEENFKNIEFPITYSVLLKIVDNDGAWEYISHNILLYPNEYKLYFNKTGLTYKKPILSKFLTKVFFRNNNFNINSNQDIIYELSDYITLEACDWEASIYIEKPMFNIINRIRIVLLNKTGNIITEEKINLKLLDLWEKKLISINGKIRKNEEFKSIRLCINGISLKNDISIIYGGDKPSNICFNFI
jgi:hypothetical protein